VLEPCNAKVLRTVLRGLAPSNGGWLLGGCVASMGQHYLTGNGADFAMVFQLETICGTDAGSRANDGSASCWCSFPHAGGSFSTAVRVGRRSVSSRLYSSVVEYGRVLVFHGGVIECSSRMKGNFQVRFLEGWPPAMGAGYSATMAGRQQLVRERSDNESCNRKVGTSTVRERCSC
jgi:hypothetical protein